MADQGCPHAKYFSYIKMKNRAHSTIRMKRRDYSVPSQSLKYDIRIFSFPDESHLACVIYSHKVSLLGYVTYSHKVRRVHTIGPGGPGGPSTLVISFVMVFPRVPYSKDVFSHTYIIKNQKIHYHNTGV